MYQCISINKIKPECLDTFLDAARKLADHTRTENGLIYYNVLQNAADPYTIVLIEKWEEEKDFQAHVANADKEGDPVHEFGKIVGQCAAGEGQILPCSVKY